MGARCREPVPAATTPLAAPEMPTGTRKGHGEVAAAHTEVDPGGHRKGRGRPGGHPGATAGHEPAPLPEARALHRPLRATGPAPHRHAWPGQPREASRRRAGPTRAAAAPGRDETTHTGHGTGPAWPPTRGSLRPGPLAPLTRSPAAPHADGPRLPTARPKPGSPRGGAGAFPVTCAPRRQQRAALGGCGGVLLGGGGGWGGAGAAPGEPGQPRIPGAAGRGGAAAAAGAGTNRL